MLVHNLSRLAFIRSFFLTDVYKMSIQTKAYTMSSVTNEGNKVGDDAVATLSRDQLILKFDVSLAPVR
jgi:hypothetical protein